MNFALMEVEDAKVRIKAKQEQKIQEVKEKVLREIQPKFAEIDQATAEELNSLTNNLASSKALALEHYNTQINTLQQNYESKQREVIEQAQKRKDDLLKVATDQETYEINKNCERTITDLNNILVKRAEKE